MCLQNERDFREEAFVGRDQREFGASQSPKGMRSAVPTERLILARKRGPPARGQKGRKIG